MKFSLLIVFIGLSFCQCGDDDNIQPQKVRVIILCDVSNSTTLQKTKPLVIEGLNKLKNYVGIIPKWEMYPIGSDFYYYPVSDNIVSEQLVSEVTYSATMGSQLEPEKRRVDVLTDSIKSKLDSLSKKMKNSCLLLSIQRSIGRFNELIAAAPPGDTSKNELIIISDMIESCKNTDTSSIEMSVIDTSKLNKSLTIFNKEHPDFDVTKLRLRIKVLINSPWMGKSYEAVQKSWEDWFAKIGVSKENIIFFTDNPNFPINPLLK